MEPFGISRRDFIGGGIALSAIAAIGQTVDKPKALFGTQLYGWGQYYERMGKKLADHLDEALSAVRDIGYDYAEGSVDLGNPEANAAFAQKLKAKGMQPVSLYTGGRFHIGADQEKTLSQLFRATEVCSLSGFKVINCNPDPIGRAKTEAELKMQLAGLKALSAKLRGANMELGIHHHTPEFANNAEEFHYNFKGSDRSEIGFCYDVHWVFRGGVKPEDALKAYGDRIVSWHLRQSREGVWWEDLAEGDINYQAIAEHAARRKLRPWHTVELALEPGTKITRSVVQNHQRSLEFARKVFTPSDA